MKKIILVILLFCICNPLTPKLFIATVKEPVSGWIDNFYGATGVLLGVAVGLLRVLHYKSSNHADMVPADYVINSALAAAWEVASMKSINDNKEVRDENSREEKFGSKIPVYNYVSTPVLGVRFV